MKKQNILKNKLKFSTINIYVDDVMCYYQFLNKIFGFALIHIGHESDNSISITLSLDWGKMSCVEASETLHLRILKKPKDMDFPPVVFGLRAVDISKKEVLKNLRDQGVELKKTNVSYSFEKDVFIDNNGNYFHIETLRFSEFANWHKCNLHLKHSYDSIPDETVSVAMNNYFSSCLLNVTVFIPSVKSNKTLFIDLLGFEMYNPEYIGRELVSFGIKHPNSDFLINFKNELCLPENSTSPINFYLKDYNEAVGETVFESDLETHLPFHIPNYDENGNFLSDHYSISDPQNLMWDIKI